MKTPRLTLGLAVCTCCLFPSALDLSASSMTFLKDRREITADVRLPDSQQDLRAVPSVPWDETPLALHARVEADGGVSEAKAQQTSSFSPFHISSSARLEATAIIGDAPCPEEPAFANTWAVSGFFSEFELSECHQFVCTVRRTIDFSDWAMSGGGMDMSGRSTGVIFDFDSLFTSGGTIESGVFSTTFEGVLPADRYYLSAVIDLGFELPDSWPREEPNAGHAEALCVIELRLSPCAVPDSGATLALLVAGFVGVFILRREMNMDVSQH